MTLREYSIASVHPDSPMTEEYRSTLLRKLADQARAELVAAHTYSRWVHRTPNPEEKLHLAALAREETDHWFRAVKLMEELGVPADQVADYQTHDVFVPIVRVLAGRIRWVDLLMMSFLIDHAAYFLVEDFAQSSYAPWAKMSKGILIEEETHSDFGSHFIEAQVEKLGRAPRRLPGFSGTQDREAWTRGPAPVSEPLPILLVTGDDRLAARLVRLQSDVQEFN